MLQTGQVIFLGVSVCLTAPRPRDTKEFLSANRASIIYDSLNARRLSFCLIHSHAVTCLYHSIISRWLHFYFHFWNVLWAFHSGGPEQSFKFFPSWVKKHLNKSFQLCQNCCVYFLDPVFGSCTDKQASTEMWRNLWVYSLSNSIPSNCKSSFLFCNTNIQTV